MTLTAPVQIGSDRDRAQAAEALAAIDAAQGAGDAAIRVGSTTVKLSNPSKVMYPAVGFTKLDVARYYAQVAPVLLPHLRDRAVTLKRYPDGVEGEFFYQKRCPAHRPAWVRTAELRTDPEGEAVNYCIPEDVRGLIWMASLADLELHVLLSSAQDVHRPTSVVFDLDPGEGVDIVACAQVGLLIRDLFAQLGLDAYAKTSGSKGMQVYVPLNVPDVTFDDTKPFAKAVAQLLEREHPDLVVHRMQKELRRGKVLVDYSQNDDHKTTVCAYSLRAKREPTASTPVTWDEVEETSAARDASLLRFRWDEIPGRVAEHGDLMAPVLEQVQPLPALG